MQFLVSKGGWLLRVATLVALLAAIAFSLGPRMLSHISTSATVNAPVMILRSPLEGIVEAVALATGAEVTPGEDIISFREAHTESGHLTDLEARIKMAAASADAVAARIAEVERLRAELRMRQDRYASWHAAVLRAEIDEIDAQIRGAETRLALLQRGADRTAQLAAKGTIPEQSLDDAESAVAEQMERIRELRARHAGRRTMLDALDDGIIAGTSGTNTPYMLQRLDETTLELALLRDELSEHRAERRALKHQLTAEQAVFREEKRVALASPVGGVVWRSAAAAGRPVLPGDEVLEILDCNARFLEAYLPENLIGTISLGDLAEVRLTGETRVFQAPVISVLGRGAQYDHAELAARDSAPKTGKMRVLIALGAEHMDFDASRFCHVGRTAQVSFPRDLSRVSAAIASLAGTADAVVAWVAAAIAPVLRG